MADPAGTVNRVLFSPSELGERLDLIRKIESDVPEKFSAECFSLLLFAPILHLRYLARTAPWKASAFLKDDPRAVHLLKICMFRFPSPFPLSHSLLTFASCSS